jgi:hypothetical protein
MEPTSDQPQPLPRPETGPPGLGEAVQDQPLDSEETARLEDAGAEDWPGPVDDPPPLFAA